MYQNNLLDERVQDVVNINKIKLEPYGDLIDQAFSQYNENFENDETPRAEYINENDSKDTETKKTSAIPKFMPKMLQDDEKV